MVVINKDEHSKLQATLLAPSLEFLHLKCNEKGMTLVEQKDLDNLKSSVEDPSLEYLEKSASNKGYALVDKRYYQK